MTVGAGLDGDRCASDQVMFADRSEHDMFQSPLGQCATGICPWMIADWVPVTDSTSGSRPVCRTAHRGACLAEDRCLGGEREYAKVAGGPR